jgi:hypothetical protein
LELGHLLLDLLVYVVVEHDGRRLIVSRPSTAPPLVAGNAVTIAVTGEVHVVARDAKDSPTAQGSLVSASRGVVVGR